MDRRILPIPGVPHDDRHFLHRHLEAERHRYESTITWACSEKDRQARPMNARKDFRPTTKNSRKFATRTRTTEFFCFRREREKTRQRLFDEEVQEKL